MHPRVGWLMQGRCGRATEVLRASVGSGQYGFRIIKSHREWFSFAYEGDTLACRTWSRVNSANRRVPVAFRGPNDRTHTK